MHDNLLELKKLLSYVVLFLVLVTSSCKKDTDTQMLAKRLQDVINNEHFERVLYTYNSVGDPANCMIAGDYGTHYNFDPPFVTIENKPFSLIS